ncbi:N-carbamoyl-D-amino acid hydrolase [Rubripirellula obstinata]|uniref:N-carbamoyl-D-amino acid hydrolase n=1 Tax=Rubripirellula obstinata TaxID=406547 RepID=A0A5B1CKC2_9BACT|nr:carbon-nitrogen hydrolase family protein [Rubripirellula obstinata]KAA1259990.1 N-carbamoyl-D-amino acid hydrolase [Rubripirellula obstinata]
MLLACVQTDVKIADISANLKRVQSWLETASTKKVELAVFPECMLTGYAYDDRESAFEIAIPIASPVFTELTLMAERLNIFFTLGFLEKDGSRLFNSSALIGPNGIEGVYRKVHLPNLGVDRFVDRGDIPYRTFDACPQTDAGPARVGMAICYDCSFPEPMRVLGLAGADIVALGTNWPVSASRTADVVPPARSMENHYFFVAANRVGTENGFQFCGRSSICGPDGSILARTETDEEIMLTAEVDLTHPRNKRIERTSGAHSIDRFKDRRPEFYGPIAD